MLHSFSFFLILLTSNLSLTVPYHFDEVTCAKHLDGFQGLRIPLRDFAVKPRAHQALADPNDADDGPAHFARGGA